MFIQASQIVIEQTVFKKKKITAIQHVDTKSKVND